MLVLIARHYDVKKAKRRAKELLVAMHLEKFATAYPATLSGGMRQRVSLARAFALQPELLLLDEPFTGLDPELKFSLKQNLEFFLEQSGTAALYVTHDVTEIPRTTHRVLSLMHGAAHVQTRTAYFQEKFGNAQEKQIVMSKNNFSHR